MWRTPSKERALPSPYRALALLLVVAAWPLHAQRIPPVANDSSQVVYDDEGLRLHSRDGRRQLRIRGLLATDALVVSGDSASGVLSTFGFRRSRLYFDANINPWIALRMQLSPAAIGSSPLAAAFVDFSFSPDWWLRVGKAKVPFGAERALAIDQQPFAERSIASQLTPDRENGAVLTGEWRGGRLEGSLGVFNGVPDVSRGDGEPSDSKDIAFRLIARPWKRPGEQGIAFGYNGSTGVGLGARVTTPLLRLNSPAARTFFEYRDTSAVAGHRTRHGVFSYAHVGPWGATAEWFRSVQRLRRGNDVGEVPAAGWLAHTELVLTGEPSGRGGVTPAQPFDPGHGHWGAFEAVARVSRLSVGRAAFPVFADPAVSAHDATEAALGMNWFFTRSTKAQLNYERTIFEGGSVAGDRRREDVLLLRLQAAF